MAYFKHALVLSFMVLSTFVQAQVLTPAQRKAQAEAIIIAQAQEQLALKKKNLFEAADEVNRLVERVCQSLKVSQDLANADICRSAAQNYFAKNILPDDDGLDLRLYKLRLSQTLCEAPYVNKHAGHFMNQNTQDTIETTQSTCWQAVLDHLKLKERSVCSGETENITCFKNIVADIASTTELQLAVAIQAQQRADALSAATQQAIEAEKAKLKK